MPSTEPNPHKVYRVVWGPQRFYLSLGWKTLIAFALVVFLPMTGLLLLTSSTMRDSLVNEMEHTLEANLQSAVETYRRPMEDVRIAIAQVADDEATASALSARDADTLRELLARESRRFPYVDAWYALDSDLVVRGRLDGPVGVHPRFGAGMSRHFERITEPVISTELLPQGVYQGRDRGTAATLPPQVPSQVIIAPIPGVGYLVALVVLQEARWLAQRIQNRLTLKDAYIALLDLDQVIATPVLAENLWTRGGNRLPQRMSESLRGGRIYHGEMVVENKRLLLISEPLLNINLQPVAAVAVAADTGRINEHIAGTSRHSYLFIAIGIILSMVIAYLAFRDTITPLKAIVAALDDFARGNHRVRTEIVTRDEFEWLGSGFNRMADAVVAQHRRLEQYNALSSLVNLSLSPTELLQGTLDRIIDISSSQLGAIYLLEERTNRLTPLATYALDIDSIATLKIGEGLPGQAALEKEVKHLREVPLDSGFEFKLGVGEVRPSEIAYLPLVYRGELLGLLMLGTVKPYPHDEFVLIEHLSRQLAIILNDSIAQQRISDLLVRDSLTGVSNRAHFTQRLDTAWNQAYRFGTHLGLLMVDIDHFRQFADRYGYNVADGILTTVATVLKKSIRKTDLIARYGENRFVIMLANADIEQCIASAEKVRKNIIGTSMPQLERERITISIGAVSHPEVPVQSPFELVRRANETLDEAKRGGRNRVVAAS